VVAAGTLQMGIQPSDMHRELKDVINVAGGHLPDKECTFELCLLLTVKDWKF